MDKKKKFILVNWVEDQTIGVMPLSSVRKEDAENIAVGSVCQVKWGSKYFSAEVLKMSGKCWLGLYS